MGNINWHNLEAGYLLSHFSSYSELLKESLFSVSSRYFFLSPSFLLLISIALSLLIVIRRLFILKRSLSEEPVFLELTPPALTDKTSYTTARLFSVVHELGKIGYPGDKLLGKKTVFSFEISSTLKQGIRYFIRTTRTEEDNIKKSLLAYLPQISVKEATDYLPGKAGGLFCLKVLEFKLNRHFAFPLKKQNVLEEHDPLAYITGMMTKLKPGELVSFQIVLSPVQPKETETISDKILHGDDVFKYLERIPLPSLFKPLTYGLSLLSKLLHPFAALPKRTYNTFEQQAVKSIQEKIEQPLFETSVRLLLMVKNKNQIRERKNGFVSSLATFSVPKYQAFKAKYNLLPWILDKINLFNFQKRRLSWLLNSSPVYLSLAEVSDLYHFPFKRVTQTEDLVKVYAKDLPAPLSLKNTKLDYVFAKNSFGGTVTDIGLTDKEREKHVYIIGATGTGKTTMIMSMANNDLKNGKGLCVIDPHGDLAESIIACVPDERISDFIYFNPDDIKYPIGLNLLELTPGLDEDELLREKELITESVVSLFRKIFSEVWSAHAHRIEYILRNTIQTALCLKDPTIFTAYRLLTDPEFQKSAMHDVTDENLKNFWKNEFGKAGDFQKVKMIGPITSRIGRLLFSPSAKRILEQPRSTINFDEILDKGKILVCNLSKGRLGEDTSEVLGIMILTKIQLASLKRARIDEGKRSPYYVYVDEFQTFATPSFIQMISESRKYKVYLVMAEQSTSQQKDRNITNVIIANVGTVISFRSANPEDEKLMLPQFEPYVDKGEITNLPSFKFYMKISAITPREPFSGETILTPVNKDKDRCTSLIQSSRNLYAKEYLAPVATKVIPRAKKPGKEEVFESISVLT